MAEMHYDSIKAVFLALGGFFLFSIVDVFAKWMGQYYSASAILLLCAITGLAMLLPFILWHKGWRGLIPRRPLKYHLWRAVQTAANGLLIVTALKYIPLADYYGIVFATPFVTAIFSVFFFKDHVGWHRWLAIAVGFVGVWVIVSPSYHDFNIGTVMALFVPVTLAINAMLLRKIGKDEYPLMFPLYSFLGLLVFNLPVVFLTGAALPALVHLPLYIPYTAAIIFAIALLGRAFAIAPVTSTVAPLQYSSMLWGTLFGYFFFHELPTWNTWVGAAVIIGAGLYLVHRERAVVLQNTH